MDFEKLLTQKEGLHPDLAGYVFSDNGLTSLNHPLIIEVPYSPDLNALINYRYQMLREECKKAILAGIFNRYVFLHERPYRLQAFAEIAGDLSDTDYWQLLGELWQDSENIWQNKEKWMSALSSTRPRREHMMDKNDLKAFAKLPDSLTIYRGYHSKSKNKDGLSWTLSNEKAEWFANRFFGIHGKGLIATETVSKSEVIAYFTGRNEQEIVWLPS